MSMYMRLPAVSRLMRSTSAFLAAVLTQGALGRLLRLGANTISRWESGRNVQTAAMDVLLRLISDLPGSIEYLRHHAA